MTVSSIYAPQVDDGDGVSVIFPVSFRFDKPADVQVVVYGVDGVARVPAFIVTGTGDPGGSIQITNGAPLAGEKVVRSRATELVQPVNYEAGDFPSSAHERSADRLTMAAQERAAIAARTLRLDDRSLPISALGPVALGRTLIRTAQGFGEGPSVEEIAGAQEIVAEAIVVAQGIAQTAVEQSQVARDLAQDFAIEAAADALRAEQAAASSGLSGRNLIINGAGRVNQRGYVSGTPTTVANQYTLDMWRVVVSGQSLLFTSDAARKVMTAPAGGVEQIILGANIVGGSYCLDWFGTATCTVNGVAVSKGVPFLLAANTAVTVRFIAGTFTDVMHEFGVVSTPYEVLGTGDILRQCELFYTVRPLYLNGYGLAGTTIGATVNFLMSDTPFISISDQAYLNASGLVADAAGSRGVRIRAVVTANGNASANCTIRADSSP